MDSKALIAQRVAQELVSGDLVNLGIGLPTLVTTYLPEGIRVFFQSENGLIGMQALSEKAAAFEDLTDAGGTPASFIPGAAAFDSVASFGFIRGGHLDVTVLGGLQVDEGGQLANWMVPGKMVPGMGGAMDLVTGAKKVIVAMTHTAKGAPKIIKKCNLPLTSVRRVDLIVTDLAVIEPTDDGLVLREVAPEMSIDDVTAATEAKLLIPDDVKQMPVWI
ncbi:acetate CoA/acetoacetate CoA-transferase beta subunit [Rhodobium orientis]|uniref:Succinyl-CoA--3-ketoacid-CoA transferase n=1 Tax=Rhodobium orientis TaxID=34017 RepID=A0A327JR10_9HYPH|nr:3-oxoacid CoA-transferase subunit B [Rhodobium orientis]MBB4303256.1 acetate CoA/acetoacetate CoA-transferase beta subunit [Rhodobium orientis]MBK5951644.1 succinyl-CoA--3-ketoacid-CoA transferase [Rhodobium orientis]RAI27843.1 succinyl-CoA--3-ketoacid-CoA transferase [Rhodobium orientis]